jgi:hypothetical protein
MSKLGHPPVPTAGAHITEQECVTTSWGLEHTNLCTASKVNESPRMLYWPPQHVARLQVQVCPARRVHAFQPLRNVMQDLHAQPN